MAAEVSTASESLLVIDAASDLLPIIPSDNQTSPLPKEAPEMPSLAKTTPPPAPLPHRRLSKHAIEAASVKVVASTEVAEPSKLDATADAEPTAPEKTSPPKPILVPSGAPRSHRDDAPEPASSMHFEMYEDDSDETPLLEAKSDATSSPIYDDEWVVCQTEVGYAYYYNTRTHASQWEAPLADDNGRDAFFSAVTAGDVGATTRLLLRYGRQLLDATDHNGRSAVWYALGHMSMAQLLFESGANLDLTDVDANGLVHVATRQRNIAFLTLLAVYGANLDLADGAQQTALHIAAACGYQRCVDVLLRHGATSDVLDSAARSPLQLSTLGNHISCVQLLQTASAQPAAGSDTALLAQRAEFEREMQKALAQCDELQQRYTTLETAHRIANARIVMLEAVVDRCEKDLDAERALLWQKEQAFNDAQQAQYATLQDLQRQVDDVVQFAARSRCEVTALSESHAPERESAGPLYVEEDDATSLEPSDTIAFDDDEMNGVVKVDETPIAPERVGAIWSAFFNNAAKARAHDDGPSKVLDAVYDGDLVTLQALLVHGASPDSRNDDDQTPLHIACAHGRLECASLLCEYMADMEARDAHGHTPLFLACRRGHLAIVKFLLESAADVHTANDDGRTLVHAAALGGSLPCLHLVLEYGGDPFAADRDGETPYEMLLERGDETAAPLLDYLDSQCSLHQPPVSPRPTTTAAAPAPTSSYDVDEDAGQEAPGEGWRGWIRGKATSLLGLDRTVVNEDTDEAAAEAPLSALKPPTDAEVASSMAYRKLVPPRHVEEAMQHLQSTAQHASSAPSSTRSGMPRDVANALHRRSSTNQFALATDAKSLHQKQKSSARYVDIAFHP